VTWQAISGWPWVWARLEDNLLGEPSKWSAQLEELRRMQKVLVRHKRFGKALDLLKVADDKAGGMFGTRT